MTNLWNGQKVVVIGAARQGLALARYLLQHGARVTLTDQRSDSQLSQAIVALRDLEDAGLPLELVLGGHPASLLDGADLLCPSGGVPLNLPLVVEALSRGIPLSNDSQIFMQVVPCKVIGITGSAGKTTTTTLVGRMAEAAVSLQHSEFSNSHAWVGGNIGSPLISAVDQMQPGDLAVMELSSFQLELMNRSPQVAAVLNITPNHLDRHSTMEAYRAAKSKILAYQSPDDVAVLGRDDPGAWGLREMSPGKVFSFGRSELLPGENGVFISGDELYLQAPTSSLQSPVPIIERRLIQLPGIHNLLNVLAACAIAAAAGLPVESMRAGVMGFAGVPHRLEFVRQWGGAAWYNDSIATAPERAIAAIRSFDGSLVLLAGGRDKNLPWGEFAELVHQRVDHLIVFGEAADLILHAIDEAAPKITGRKISAQDRRLDVIHCKNLSQAVQAAARLVQPGDVVLLSPGGTSFDEFKDFEERGECFAQWVKELP